MKTGRKVILIISLAVLLVVASVAGAVFYYYAHPSSVKALIEASVSQATGASVAIRSLSYAIDPWNIAVKGITLRPRSGIYGLYLEIPELQAGFSLDGPFGRRRLIIKRLEIKGLSCRISQDASVSGTVQTPHTASFFSSILKRMFGFFIFRDLKLDSASIADGAAVVQSNDQILRVSHIEARLNPDQPVELTCGVQWEWPSREMSLLAPDVRIKTDRAISLLDPQIGGSIALNGAVFEGPVADIRDVRGGATLVYWPSAGKVTFEQMSLALEKAEIKEGGQTEVVRLGLNLTADGAFSLKDHHLTARPLHLTIGEGLQFEGGLEAAVGSRKTMTLDVVSCHVTPQELIQLLPSAISKRTGSLNLAGKIPFTGKIGGVEESSKWVWDADLEAHLEQNQVSFTKGNVSVRGVLTGGIGARGRVPDLEISAAMEAKHATVSGGGMDVKPFEASISLSGRYPAFDLKGLSARIPQARARFKEKTFGVDNIHVQVQEGQVNMATQAVSLPKIRFDSSLLKNITASIEAADGKPKIVEIQGKETGLAGLAVGLGLLPSGWKLAGRDSVQVQVRFDVNQGTAVTSQWVFQDMGFQDPEAAFAGEKVSLQATINGKRDPSNHVMTADIAIRADKGEVLYDRFYVDLKRHALSSHCTGTYNIQRRDLHFSNLRLGLKDILACQINGRILKNDRGLQFDLSADIPEIPLKPAFSLFVVEPFKAEKPLLGAIQVGGTVCAELNLSGIRSDWDLKGSVRWGDGGILSHDKGISLKGIDLSLPLWVRSHDTDDPLKALKGRLSIGSLSLPYIPEQALDVPLEAGPNRLSIILPTVVKIPGGDIRLGPVVIRGLIGPSPSLSTDLAMNRVDMGPLLAGIWDRAIEGTLNGRLDPVHVEGGRLTSSGKITAKVFDGEVIFSDPGASGFLTGTPVFKLDARWKDLNLSELTADTSFGKIEGLLNGYAKGLEIAEGQPQRFDLLLQTVRKEGTPQRISVKAVDNIARIGSGQSPFIGLAGMFASVFKEFPYEKIGVHATLENDVFRINGTIREGGAEYLVKRGLLSGVNVVNQNPDNQVSFKDMIKRIQRIQTSKGGPVIK